MGSKTGMTAAVIGSIPAIIIAFAPTSHADVTCGPGVVAIGPTSCPFAFSVASAYHRFIGSGAGQLWNVYSPTTGQSYDLTCDQLGVWADCRGGNYAEVRILP
jgi:hypothetical protein